MNVRLPFRAWVRLRRPLTTEAVVQVVRGLVIAGAGAEQVGTDDEDVEREEQTTRLSGEFDVLPQQVAQDGAADRDRQHRVEVEPPQELMWLQTDLGEAGEPVSQLRGVWRRCGG
jgi:hypothetical protein